jgi:hypothetical protein
LRTVAPTDPLSACHHPDACQCSISVGGLLKCERAEYVEYASWAIRTSIYSSLCDASSSLHRPETSNLNRKLLLEMAITWRDLAEEARVEAVSVETLSKAKLQ